MPKRNPPPWGGSFLGVFGCFGFGMSSRLMRCSLNSSRRGKGMACLAFGNSFLFSFHGVHVYSRKRREKKSSCHVSSGIRRCCPLNSWRKQRQNQSIHTYLIIWVWIIPYHSCTKLMMPCRTWWLEKAGPIAQTHMLVLFAVEMLPL